MLYYALEYNMADEEPEGRILWETESESLVETQKLITVKYGCEYEIVSEADIREDIEKLYDVEALLN